ncbi:MAG: hypothetical protein V1495_01920 [Pseudomonadota bacterium]
MKKYLTIAVLVGLAVPGLSEGAKKVVPKDALVLEKGVVIRQFGDNRGKVIAKPEVCDELLLLEPVGFKGKYEEVLFLTPDAQKVRRGWILASTQLYIFPEPRPAIPRSDATPGVAFPWSSKAAQPGDPDFARVTNKAFLFACLDRPHPAKAATVLTQILDRYAGELTAEEVTRLLPVLKYCRDEDRPRIRELLAKFSADPAVKGFLAANPIFGPVMEPENKPLPQETPPPVQEENQLTKLLKKFPPKVLGMVAGGMVVFLVLIVLLFRRKKPPSDTLTMGSEDDLPM